MFRLPVSVVRVYIHVCMCGHGGKTETRIQRVVLPGVADLPTVSSDNSTETEVPVVLCGRDRREWNKAGRKGLKTPSTNS